MRSEMHEPGQGRLAATTRTTAEAKAPLPPSAIDAALEDDAAPVVTQRGSRREFIAAGAKTEAARMAIDEPHAAATETTGDAGLIRQLSRQISMLEVQQEQIRKLLELTERRFATR
jgi:hypothetical protein